MCSVLLIKVFCKIVVVLKVLVVVFLWCYVVNGFEYLVVECVLCVVSLNGCFLVCVLYLEGELVVVEFYELCIVLLYMEFGVCCVFGMMVNFVVSEGMFEVSVYDCC